MFGEISQKENNIQGVINYCLYWISFLIGNAFSSYDMLPPFILVSLLTDAANLGILPLLEAIMEILCFELCSLYYNDYMMKFIPLEC